jgi:hypothetical protein
MAFQDIPIANTNTQKILTSTIVNSNSLKEYFANDKDFYMQLIGTCISDTTPRRTILEESITTVK